MTRLSVWLVAVVALASVAIAGCSASAPAPSPTKAAAPTTAAVAAPTTVAAAAAPTSAPAPKINYPDKGRPITVIIPYGPGGGTDINARMVISGMEKELGVSVQPLNKDGAGSQVGVQELSTSKPDGYTLGATSQPGTTLLYLDAERKAAFDRKSFEPIAMYGSDPEFLTVKADSPYKTVKDLVDAAKANPDKVKFGTPGLLGAEHLAILLFAQQAGFTPSAVHFTGSAPGMTALLGGHIDVYVGNMATFASPFKNGDIRFLAVMDNQTSPLAPGVPTLESQGYKADARIGRIMSAPAGTPKEIVNILGDAIKKAIATEDYKKKAAELYLTPLFLDAQQTGKYWDDEEAQLRPLVAQVMKDR